MTRVAVLLAARNGAEWIEEQVASIIAQEGVDVRLIVGDDASRDDTRARVVARWGDDTRVQVRAFDAPSGSAGANFLRLVRAVDVADCDAVAFSDQDDVWWPAKLARGIKVLRAADAVGASAAVEARWYDGRTAVLDQCPRTRRADFLFEGAGQGCTFVLDRAFFERVQSFLRSPAGAAATMHFHDWLVYLLSRAWGERWAFDPRPCMTYRQHGGNEIGARGGRSGFVRRFAKIYDGWFAGQIAKACTVYVAAGGADPAVLQLVDLLGRGHARSRFESALLALRLLRDGRRRSTDRAALAVSALLRWI